MTGFEVDPVEGQNVGRDPRQMTNDDLRALGHEPAPVLSIIRAKCLDCCGDSPSEVRRCTVTRCALWPFRMNHNPWREKREMSDEQRDEIRARFAAARASKAEG